MSLVKQIKADPNFKKFTRIFEGIQKRVDLEGSLTEALGLHAGRLSRNITGEKRYSPKTVIDAVMQDLSYRARLVEIRVRNDIQLANLREAIGAMRRHISTEYSEDLRDFSTADQRKALVDRVIKTANQFIAEGEALLETLDALIKDIDQAGHGLRHIVECMKLLDGSKGGKVV